MRKTLLYIIFIFFYNSFTYGQDQELIVKAAYLEKFAMFTEWPEDALKDKSSPFVINVYGDEVYYNAIKKFYSDHRIREKKVVVRLIDNINDIINCQILFITKIDLPELNKIINRTKKNPILTVADTEGYASRGVIINLFLVKNKIRFEINESALKPSGLILSYHLLKFAKIVGSSEN